MRLLINLNDQKQGYALSAYLTKEGFENKLELTPDTDWGSPDFGNVSCKIWVIDEDHFDEAKKIAEDFSANPADARYYGSQKPASIAPKPLINPLKPPAPKVVKLEPMGSLTFYLIVLCSLILFFSELAAPPQITTIPANLPLTPLMMPQLYKDLMYDYPHAYEIIDKIVNAYGINALQNPDNLPNEGKLLLQQFYRTPYWTGFYDVFLHAHKHPETAFTIDAPLFEKERQGEIWRFFTPCLLHGTGQRDLADILHLVFNMLWLALLGRQMESRLGKRRYLLFILLVGVFSNTAQYLMGGANFLGFSGVVCGMLAFIWVRRREAAWEGYQLQPGTIGFFSFVILLMFGVQFASFIMEYFFGYPLSPGIANTAHLSGILLGYLLGKLKFFAWKMT